MGYQLSDTFEICKWLNQEDALSPLLFNFALDYAIRSMENKKWLELNGINQLLEYADDVALLWDSEEVLRLNGNGHLRTDEGDFDKVSKFKYLGTLITK